MYLECYEIAPSFHDSSKAVCFMFQFSFSLSFPLPLREIHLRNQCTLRTRRFNEDLFRVKDMQCVQGIRNEFTRLSIFITSRIGSRVMQISAYIFRITVSTAIGHGPDGRGFRVRVSVEEEFFFPPRSSDWF
jgi:hypothetical protein